MKGFAPVWAVIFILCFSGYAYPEEFKCLEGAKDSGPQRPGDVLRWCEISKDGALLYHGSVWSWHRNGQMESRGFYIFGNADGEWPSWYENGKPSSLGRFKNGRKTGLWKYWDEDGSLKTEVTHLATGNLWTEYYPTGKKRATGKAAQSGKIGYWTYWDRNGKVKATCDFGDGLFTLSSNSCQVIADELEPKGFSQPIPIAMTTPESGAVIKIASQKYQFVVPQGWVADTEAGPRDQVPLVFYPQKGSWRDSTGPNIYIRALYKNGETFDSIVENETKTFEQNVDDFAGKKTKRWKLQNSKPIISKTIKYKPLIQTDSPFSIVADNSIHETINFIDASDRVVIMIVLACHSHSQLEKSTSALTSLSESLRVYNVDGK